MAKFHDRLRKRVEEFASPEPVEAMVLLSSVTGGSSVTYNAEQDYVHDRGLDPALRIDDRSGGFGLLCALTPSLLDFLESEGNMRSGDIRPAWSSRRDEVTVAHRAGGLPGARTRLFHFAFQDGRYYLGSAPEGRIARNALNDPAAFVEALGSRAVGADA